MKLFHQTSAINDDGPEVDEEMRPNVDDLDDLDRDVFGDDAGSSDDDDDDDDWMTDDEFEGDFL